MKLRRYASMKAGLLTTRVKLLLTNEEAAFIFRGDVPEKPRAMIEVANGLLTVRAPHKGEEGSLSLWKPDNRADGFENQMSVQKFPGVDLSAYDTLTEVEARRNGHAHSLQAMLKQLPEGVTESPAPPPPIQRAPRGSKRAKAPETPGKTPPQPKHKPPAVHAPQKEPSEENFMHFAEAQQSGDHSNVMAQLQDQFGITSHDKTMLRMAVDIINGHIKRSKGTVKAHIDPISGLIRLEMLRIHVDTEEL